MRGRTNSSFTMSMQPIRRSAANLYDRDVPRCSSSPTGGSTKKNGGARRSRTDDILLAKQALYQLSYGPISGVSQESCQRPSHAHQEGLVGPGRLELPTLRLSGVRSNHLSYGPMAVRQAGKNPRLAITPSMPNPNGPGVDDGMRKEKRRRRRPA